MTLPNSLSEIVTRINQGSLTEADLQALSQIIGSAIAQGDRAVAIAGDAQAATITTGDGNVVLNVVFQADGLQIAGRSVQGQAVETLRQLLQGSLPAIEIDWQQVSRSLLNEQIQRLTTNPLTHAEGITYRTEQVYVPLGLVERKKVSRRGEDVSPEQGSLLYEETEITRKFEHEEFLEQVLQRGQSPRSGGRRIAVIGEPGAGKTTLLQQMARWVAEKIEGAIAIWVSLADLQGRSVEDYLLGQWLPAVVQQQGRAEASMLVKDAFVAQVNAGRVWLLLDGVDEMPVATGNPLGEMERQVRLGGLLGQARIVLTCRLNLWDGDRLALDAFDVYRTLEFAYPGQVEQFVGQWFEALPEVQARQGTDLCEALRQPGKARLRDLVKNPLRLTLLCFNWYLGAGTLPETKAGLYEQFVADFYEWKRERFPTTAEQRRRLNTALGELAREAIDKEATRFRLRHDFVCEFLGEPDEPDSLFQMALRLGWLNQIGVDAENRRKAVYAFFHPTFQEYFAATSIQSRRFFLPHMQIGDHHRAFELKFEEVYLLWIGQNRINELEKHSLIQELFEFDDQCGGYFSYQALLLAGAALTEVKSSPLTETILMKLCDMSFGKPDKSSGKWSSYIDPLPEMAEMALLKAPHQLVAEIVANNFIPAALDSSHPSEGVAHKGAKILGLISCHNIFVIDALIQLIKAPDFFNIPPPVQNFTFVRSTASESLIRLAKSDYGNYIVRQLELCFGQSQIDSIKELIAITLGKIDPANSVCLLYFEENLDDCKDEKNRFDAAWSIISFDENHVRARKTLSLLEDSKDDNISYYSREILKQGATIHYEHSGYSYSEEEIQEAQSFWDCSKSIFSLLRDNTPDLAQKWAILEIQENFKEDYRFFIDGLLNNLIAEEDSLSLQLSVELLGRIGVGDANVLEKILNFLLTSNPIFSSATIAIFQLLIKSNKRELYLLTVVRLKTFLQGLENFRDFRALEVYKIIWLCARRLKYSDFHSVWNEK